MTVPGQKSIGPFWTPAAGRINFHRCAGLLPVPGDLINKLPSVLNLIPAVKRVESPRITRPAAVRRLPESQVLYRSSGSNPFSPALWSLGAELSCIGTAEKPLLPVESSITSKLGPSSEYPFPEIQDPRLFPGSG